MKTFEKDNHYAVLQLPFNAGPDEIRHAYREALEIYGQASTATYALFSDAQRRSLLQVIETAFATLIDAEKRAAYNQMLIDTGQVDAAVFTEQAQRQMAARTAAGTTSTEASLDRWVAGRTEAPEVRGLVEAILAKDRLSGPDLRQVREAYGIELSEIYAITRISSDVLKRIEADRFDELPARVYLKQFLKSYAEILRIDAGRIVEGYLAAMARQREVR